MFAEKEGIFVIGDGSDFYLDNNFIGFCACEYIIKYKKVRDTIFFNAYLELLNYRNLRKIKKTAKFEFRWKGSDAHEIILCGNARVTKCKENSIIDAVLVEFLGKINSLEVYNDNYNY